jgi:hypothetical protein
MSTRKLAAVLLLVAGVASAAFIGAGRQPSDASVNQGTDVPRSPNEPPRYFGWINDPEAVRECLAELGCCSFRDTEAFAADDDGPEDVYLWDAARKVTGDVLPARDQKTVGSCVGFATASAIEHLLCVQIAGGAPAGAAGRAVGTTGAASAVQMESYRDLVQEVIYGGSRVEIGGGRVRGDGSIGAWAAKWVKDYGVVARGVHGPHDLREYSERRCREYGRRGVPDDLEPLAKKHPVRGVARVRSWDECRAAVRNGYPVVVCSDQGFVMERDADGFCAPRGTWYHAMAVVGVRGGDRPGGFLLNSWGPDAHTGPRVPPGAPACGFWVDAAVLDRMLRQGDSWAFSLAVGFPPSGNLGNDECPTNAPPMTKGKTGVVSPGLPLRHWLFRLRHSFVIGGALVGHSSFVLPVGHSSFLTARPGRA